MAALLAVQDEGGEARWAAVVQALLQRPVRLAEEALVGSDGLAGVHRVLRGARGAAVASFPTTSVAGSVTVPLQPDLDRAVLERFGVASPVPVIVQNGAGRPGWARGSPRRCCRSGSGSCCRRTPTSSATSGRASSPTARMRSPTLGVSAALGVGRVGVSQVPSGLGDITIIVGEDFTG